MHIIIKREDLLHSLQHVIGVVERRQTIPILAHVLIKAQNSLLILMTTDKEIEMISQTNILNSVVDFQTTIPARKLFDICKALPENSEITLTINEHKTLLSSGKSRFILSSLLASEFPALEDIKKEQTFTLPQSQLKALFDNTAFSMAQQDVRYYLNGMLLEVDPNLIRFVATDGHRLALNQYQSDGDINFEKQVIIPRKAVSELSRLLDNNDELVTVTLSHNHIRVQFNTLTFTSKLIDGKFPDYNRVIPVDNNQLVKVNRVVFKNAMNRISILSNEKYRGIRLKMSANNLLIQANNPDHEEAEEELTIHYDGADIEIGFNVTYLIDVLNILKSEDVYLKLKDTNSSCIIGDGENSDNIYVIMPMRL